MSARPTPTSPIKLGFSRQDHFYRGGDRLAQFRGSVPSTVARSPEEWLGSTVARHGDSTVGVTLVGDSRLDDLIASDPAAWLGPEWLGSSGIDATGYGASIRTAPVLVKLLDAAERLPVHVHPDAQFARKHLGADRGKAEAWLILHAPPGGGEITLGFREDVSASSLRQWTREQTSAPLLKAMHSVTVQVGDTVFVPPGVPHSIGEGIFLLEVQEPTDFSILLEWEKFPSLTADSAMLGLNSDVAREAVRRARVSDSELERWVTRASESPSGVSASLPYESEKFFRLEVLSTPNARFIAEGFRILVVLEGQGDLTWSSGSAHTGQGEAWLVPHAVGSICLEGNDLTAALATGSKPASP